MPPLSRRRAAFPIAVAVTLVVSLLPGAWLRRLGDLGTIVNVPLIPLRHGANVLAEFVAPPPPGEADDVREASRDELFEESRRWRLRYLQMEQEVRQLRAQIRQLERLPSETLGPTAVKPVFARVTGVNPDEPNDARELNRGTRHGVVEGTVAVYDGINLVGRVREASAVRSELLPLTSTETGFIQARVMPDERAEEGLGDAPIVQLEPIGDGTFAAEAARDSGIAEGDEVWLADPGWPRVAQMMIIGTVASIRPRDDQPLRNALIVRPLHELHTLSSVTLAVETREGEPPAGEEEAGP